MYPFRRRFRFCIDSSWWLCSHWYTSTSRRIAVKRAEPSILWKSGRQKQNASHILKLALHSQSRVAFLSAFTTATTYKYSVFSWADLISYDHGFVGEKIDSIILDWSKAGGRWHVCRRPTWCLPSRNSRSGVQPGNVPSVHVVCLRERGGWIPGLTKVYKL